MVHCGLASVHKSSVHHALYGVVCTKARPACTSFIGSQKRTMCATATSNDGFHLGSIAALHSKDQISEIFPFSSIRVSRTHTASQTHTQCCGHIQPP